MIQHTISEQLSISASKGKNSIALAFPDENVRVSYEELDIKTDAVAKALIGVGVKHGSNIGIWGENCANWVYIALGAAKIGAVFVPLNINYKLAELQDLLIRGDMELLFASEKLKKVSFTALLLAVENSEEYPKLKKVFSMQSKGLADEHNSYESFISNADKVSDKELAAAKAIVKIDDTYLIQCTSGTTAKPKGAMLSQYGVLNTAAEYARLLHMTHQDRTCVPLPLFHCFGNVLSLLGGLQSLSCTVFMESFSATNTISALEKEKCTAIMGVPTMYLAMMNNPTFEAADLSNLIKAGIGGAYCPEPTAIEISRKFRINHLTIGYGLSEAASLCTLSDINENANVRLNSVGKALPGLKVSLYEESSGKISNTLPQGEIVVRGFAVMKGYYNAPEETAKAIDADGWLHTGDLGYFDENGALKVSGRIKDIIIRGGENISPSEIEELLLVAPSVKQTQCVGVEDDICGEEIVAFIIPEANHVLNSEELRNFVSENLAKYKVPKYVFEIDEFPINAAGKIMKNKLRELAKKRVAVK